MGNLIVFEAWVRLKASEGNARYLIVVGVENSNGADVRVWQAEHAQMATFLQWLEAIAAIPSLSTMDDFPKALRDHYHMVMTTQFDYPPMANRMAVAKLAGRLVMRYVSGEVGWRPAYSGPLSIAKVEGRVAVSSIIDTVPVSEAVVLGMVGSTPRYEESNQSFAERRRMVLRAAKAAETKSDSSHVRAWHDLTQTKVRIVHVPVVAQDGEVTISGVVIADNPKFATILTTPEVLGKNLSWYVGETITPTSWLIGVSGGENERQ